MGALDHHQISVSESAEILTKLAEMLPHDPTTKQVIHKFSSQLLFVGYRTLRPKILRPTLGINVRGPKLYYIRV